MTAEIEVSYFEIYNEKIHDLLAVTPSLIGGQLNTPSSQLKPRPALRVREHPTWGPYVVDLNTHPVDSHAALKNWLAVGNSQRATAATGMNDKSSRSHSIFNIILNISENVPTDEQAQNAGRTARKQQTKRSKISLVDLAGSERVSHTCASGERLKEGVSINKSLLTLGKVIAALADTKKNSFVPYRESVLTWLLRVSSNNFVSHVFCIFFLFSRRRRDNSKLVQNIGRKRARKYFNEPLVLVMFALTLCAFARSLGHFAI